MRTLIVLVSLLLFTSYLTAQEQSKKIMVDTKDLPKDLVEQLEQKQKADNIKTQISTWSGLGKEVGEAVNGALGAVVDQAERFSNTDVGTFTLTILAWKLIGKDVLRIIIGISLFITVSTLLWKSYKRLCLGSETVTLRKKFLMITYYRELGYKEPILKETYSRANYSGVIILSELFLIFICSIILFI